MKIKIHGKSIDYKQFKDELYEVEMLDLLRNNKSFRKVFKIDLTDRFLAMMRGVTDVSITGFNRNTVLSINGQTGKGKTALTFSLGLSIFPNFSNENVFFHDQEVLDNAWKFKEHSLIIKDENPAKATYGIGSNRTTEQFGVLAETCRKASLNLALIEPSFQQNDITKWYLHAIDQDLNKRITRCGLISPSTFKYVGAVCIPIMAENHPEWVKYQKMKDEFIEKMKKGDYSGAKLDYKAIAQETIDDYEFIKYRQKKEKKAFLISKYPNYTTGEIEVILSLIGVMEREE